MIKKVSHTGDSHILKSNTVKNREGGSGTLTIYFVSLAESFIA